MERSGRHCTAASDREGPCAPKLHYDRKQKLFGIPVKGGKRFSGVSTPWTSLAFPARKNLRYQP